MNKQTIIEFQLKELAKLLLQPINVNTIALKSYTVEILTNLGLTADEALGKAQTLNN